MNVRFFGGRKEEYVSIPKHNPIGLYFCADSRELFLGDKLLSDGLRVVPTFADLPSISKHKAAEGIIYFVEDTKNGYVLPRGRSEWLQVIYSGTEVVLSNYYTKAEVDVKLGDYATKEDLAKVEAKIPTDYLKEIPAEYITETELTEATASLATEEYVNTAIKGIEIPKAYDDSEIRELLNAKAASEHTHDEYALTEHTHDEYLTEQSLEGYAKTSELFSKDYNELTNKPTIPSIEGLATEQFVKDEIEQINIPTVDTSKFVTTEVFTGALEEKADKVLFTTSKFVTNVIGSFTEYEDIKGRTIAELFAKLLGLSDEKPGTDEPDEPEVPEEPDGVVETIVANEIPMYAVTANGEVAEVPYKLITYDKATAQLAPTESGFYQIVDAEGNVTESGYQELQIKSDDTYYVIALPKEIDYHTMVTMQAYSDALGKWMDAANFDFTNDPDRVASICSDAEVNVSMINTELYTVWAVEECPTGSKLRFIITE
jgi:hypothetical protein